MPIEIPISVDEIMEHAKMLTPTDQARLLELLAAVVSEKLQATQAAQPQRSLRGMWAKYGPGPTEEDIEEARREMWGKYAEGGC